MIYNMIFTNEDLVNARPCILSQVKRISAEKELNNATVVYEGNISSFYFTVFEDGNEVPCMLATEKPRAIRFFKRMMTLGRTLHKINIENWAVVPLQKIRNNEMTNTNQSPALDNEMDYLEACARSGILLQLQVSNSLDVASIAREIATVAAQQMDTPDSVTIQITIDQICKNYLVTFQTDAQTAKNQVVNQLAYINEEYRPMVLEFLKEYGGHIEMTDSPEADDLFEHLKELVTKP